jgi:hypothetical protein
VIAQTRQQVGAAHAGLLSNRIERLATKRIFQIIGGDRLIRSGANPGLSDIAVSTVLELLHQVTEASAEDAASTGPGEQSAQSPFHHILQAGARSGTTGPPSQQSAQDVAEPPGRSTGGGGTAR